MCFANRSNSTKVPGSNRQSRRSRAVIFPLARCLSRAFSPPPRRNFALRSIKSRILSSIVLMMRSPRQQQRGSATRFAIPQSVLGDDDLLDIRGAFDDLVGTRIAEIPFDGILAGITISPVDLQCRVGGIGAGLAGVILGHGGLQRVRLAPVLERRPPAEPPP